MFEEALELGTSYTKPNLHPKIKLECNENKDTIPYPW